MWTHDGRAVASPSPPSRSWTETSKPWADLQDVMARPRTTLCIVLVAGLTLLSGCHGEDPEHRSELQYRISGTFTDDAEQGQIDELRGEIERHDATLIVMESSPMQYRVQTVSASDCEELRQILSESPIVADVSDCLLHNTLPHEGSDHTTDTTAST